MFAGKLFSVNLVDMRVAMAIWGWNNIMMSLVGALLLALSSQETMKYESLLYQ